MPLAEGYGDHRRRAYLIYHRRDAIQPMALVFAENSQQALRLAAHDAEVGAMLTPSCCATIAPSAPARGFLDTLTRPT